MYVYRKEYFKWWSGSLIRYPASDGIARSTITHCTSVNSSSAKTRQNPRSNLDSSVSDPLSWISLNAEFFYIYDTFAIPLLINYVSIVLQSKTQRDHYNSRETTYFWNVTV